MHSSGEQLDLGAAIEHPGRDGRMPGLGRGGHAAVPVIRAARIGSAGAFGACGFCEFLLIAVDN